MNPITENHDIWLSVPGYEGKYEAHGRGLIRNAVTKRVLRPALIKVGYLTVVLCKNSNDHKTFYVHRIIGKIFLTTPQKEMINHIDGIKTNNHISNLEWATRSENEKHAYKIGLKHTPNPAKRTIQKDMQGNVIAVFASTWEAQKNGFSSSKVSDVCNGKGISHRGYKWEYANNKNHIISKKAS